MDIFGFKSFAEKITIDFVGGVTAVVGPNGSGKSNITDAIRWVLGEQSAKSLRGSKMEDIIFSGSETRKSLNYAEVELTLDNSDNHLPTEYHEVTVTRRVYRSGESEFSINKQPCRLKDIVDLFMDSGLGKEAFSIIGQGRVEEILSSKAEDRRSVFEEAAGVLKYKLRKKKAEAKLNETDGNLNRVTDIIHELSGQIEPLRAQASLARDYLEKKAELELCEVAYLVYEIETLHDKWQEITKEIEALKVKDVDVLTQMSALEAKLEQLRAQKLQLDEKITAAQDQFTTISEEVERIEGRRAVREERLKNRLENEEKLTAEIAIEQNLLDEINQQIAKTELLSEQLTAELEQIEAQIHRVRTDSPDSQQIEAEIDSLQVDLIEMLNAKAKVKHESELIASTSAQLSLKSEKWSEESAKLTEENREITNKISLAEAELIEARDSIQQQVDHYGQESQVLGKVKKDFEQVETDKITQKTALQKLISRKEALEEMTEDYQGFFQGVREILKEKQRSLSGIEGAVAELIKVPKAYTVAIEIALGASLQSVVVDTEQSARQAIDFLKRSRAGRATFLPLSVIKGRELPNNVIEIAEKNRDYIGVGAQLIEFAPRYQAIVENLLGSTILAKDLKSANEIAKALGYRYRIVTLEGDVVSPGGSMTGGANKQKTSLLTRKNELETIAVQVKQLTGSTQQLEETSTRLQAEIRASESKLLDLRTKGEELRLLESTLQGNFASLQISQKNIQEKLAIFEMEQSAFFTEVSEKESRAQVLQEGITTLDKQIADTEAKIKDLMEQKSQAHQNIASINEAVADLNLQLVRKKEQQNFQQQNLQRLQAERTGYKQKIKERSGKLAELAKLLTDEASELELDQVVLEKRELREKLGKELSAERGKRTTLQLDEEGIERELKEIKRQARFVSNTLHDKEIKKTRIDADLDYRMTKLNQEFQLTFEAAKLEHPLTAPPSEVKTRITLLNVEVEEMGTVNTGAIEEFERVNERFEFLTTQEADLESAKSTLLDVIREMDAEMVKRFSESFQLIQHEFHQIFPQLFGGGYAELKLTDPEDMLHTGIEIVAQPPGKKLQHLSLLSGGERALTAIALLFAILRVRPVPFCVLDEVEAALDEVNVHRFANYLKQFSEDTQFIVITHRKGTMEEADVLYGVIMQESGVSKLVSVRIEEQVEVSVPVPVG